MGEGGRKAHADRSTPGMVLVLIVSHRENIQSREKGNKLTRPSDWTWPLDWILPSDWTLPGLSMREQRVAWRGAVERVRV